MYFLIAAIVFGVISLVTFILYALDKLKAKLKTRRISERTLLLSSFLGGAIGGGLAMLACRHKTRHWYFVAVNVIGLIWQVGLLIFIGCSYL